MYNAHRGMGPPGQAPPGTRLAELLEQVRAEFETQAGRSNEHEHQRKHTTDLTLVRSNGGVEQHSRAYELDIPPALGA
jgi:glucose repression regulatory protein TUP1